MLRVAEERIDGEETLKDTAAAVDGTTRRGCGTITNNHNNNN